MAVSRLVDWRSPPLAGLLDKLLRDMTTGRNVAFMTDGYGVPASEEITAGAVRELNVRTRTEKSVEAQAARTKAKAEVFTPAWLVNHMNNKCDEDWFGRPDVFNVEVEVDGKHDWTGRQFSMCGKDWHEYVKLKKLEITCGEAPFVTTRYDAVTGERLKGKRRVGFLDRKLKVVAQQCAGASDGEKVEWVLEALKSCYGYEYQGDSLLIARANVLLTTLDYCRVRMGLTPSELPLDEICDIICWNFWQMDGLNGVIPGTANTRARIMDWESGEAVHFDDCAVSIDVRPVGGEAVAADQQVSEADAEDNVQDDSFDVVGDGAGNGAEADAAGFFADEPEDQIDIGFEPACRDRIVASSVSLLVNALPRSTMSDDPYGKGRKLCYTMACQYYGMAQGLSMIMDQMDPDVENPAAVSGFGGMVGKFVLKGRVTGAMKSSLKDFRNESYEPMMDLCRTAAKAVLKACLYHQRERDLDEIAEQDLEKLAGMLDASGLPDGLGRKIRGFVSEMESYYGHGAGFRDTLDVRDAKSEDKHGMDVDVVVRDTGRLLAVCRKYILGIGI